MAGCIVMYHAEVFFQSINQAVNQLNQSEEQVHSFDIVVHVLNKLNVK